VSLLSNAIETSFFTWLELSECDDNTNNKILLSTIPFMIASGKITPDDMLRGAIQQYIPLDSSVEQIESAISLFCFA